MCATINSQRQHKVEDNNSNNLLKHNFVKPVTNKKEQHTYLSLSLFFQQAQYVLLCNDDNKHNIRLERAPLWPPAADNRTLCDEVALGNRFATRYCKI